MMPPSRLVLTCKLVRACRVENVDEIEPVNEFTCSCKDFKFVKLLNCEGMLPASKFVASCNIVSFRRADNDDGIVPARLQLARDMLIILSVASQLIPTHSVGVQGSPEVPQPVLHVDTHDVPDVAEYKS